MNILHKLQAISAFFLRTRRQGHTSAMLNGALNTADVLVITHDENFAEILRNENMNRNEREVAFMSLGNLDALIGRRSPVLIDHAAVVMLCEEASSKIDGMDRDLAEMRKQRDILAAGLDASNTVTNLIAEQRAILAEALNQIRGMTPLSDVSQVARQALAVADVRGRSLST